MQASNLTTMLYNDELYTRLRHVDREANCYVPYFANSIVICPFDNPKSAFVRWARKSMDSFNIYATVYFYRNDSIYNRILRYHERQRKETTKRKWLFPWLKQRHGYVGMIVKSEDAKSYFEYKFRDIRWKQINYGLWEGRANLRDTGSWETDEIQHLIKYFSSASSHVPILFTNPPFSLLANRLFTPIVENAIALNNMKVLIVMSTISCSYDSILSKLLNHQVWSYGHFPLTSFYKFPTLWSRLLNKPIITHRIRGEWLQNLSPRFPNPLQLRTMEECRHDADFKETTYKTLDETDIMNVDCIKWIPSDFDGTMAVPAYFVRVWNPTQFELISIYRHGKLNKKALFIRVLIKRRK